MEDLIFNLEMMDYGRIRVVISDMNLNQKGVLYFEKVKSGFINKPISMNSWACVDAKIEKTSVSSGVGLYEMGGDFSSLDILNKCQSLITEFINNPGNHYE
jgi:hypothetical protein